MTEIKGVKPACPFDCAKDMIQFILNTRFLCKSLAAAIAVPDK